MRRTLLPAVSAWLFVAAAPAQPPQGAYPLPRITSAFPCGGQLGTAVEVTVTGTDLDDATALVFSDPNLTAELIVDEVKDAKPDPKKGGGMKKKTVAPTAVKFRVTVGKGTPPGTHDVRVSGRWGVSNPRAFVVGTLPEANEKEPNNDVPEAQRVTLNSVLNGRIDNPTDVDYAVFAGKKGQRLLAHAATGSIDSRARPLVEIFADGKRLAANRNYAGTDALADVTLPADGDYLVRVSEFAYQQGGPDSFYRLTITTGPWIDAVFPPAVEAGKPTTLALVGRNLPTETLDVKTPPVGTLVVSGRVASATGLLDAFDVKVPGSNAVPVYLTSLKVVPEPAESNDTPATAQPIPYPGAVAGRIEKRYDRDVYAITLNKGDRVAVELLADRLGAGQDLYFTVRTDKGSDVVGEQDDDPDPLHPVSFFNRSADPPATEFVAAATGKYFVTVNSREAGVTFGPRSSYLLKVGPPVPAIRAIVMARSRDFPAAAVAFPGGQAALDVFVDRQGGFTGPVTATASDLPAGVTAPAITVGTGQRWGTLLLQASADAKPFTGPIRVTCAATVDGKPLTTTARPASITWGVPNQNNNNQIPTVARLDRQLMFAVRPEPVSLALSIDKKKVSVKSRDKDGKEVERVVAGEVVLKPGDRLTLPVSVGWKAQDARANPVGLVLEPTMPGNRQQQPLSTQGGDNNNPAVSVPKEKADGTLVVDVRPTAPPGSYSLTVRGDTQTQIARDLSAKDKKTPANVTAFAEPLVVTVLPTAVAKLTVTDPKVKPGASAELVVKIERLNGYAGPLELTATGPKDFTVSKATAPADATTATLTVTAPAGVKAGPVPGFLLTAVGKVEGKHAVSQETKFTVGVTPK